MDIFAIENVFYLNISTKDFPVTRYQGSKRKIIPWIYETITKKKIDFDSVLDAFGGTATVSYMFKKMGKGVIYNDYLKFNYLIGKALIENNYVLLGTQEVQSILEYSSNTHFIKNTFEGIYYLDHENETIDNIIGGIEATLKNDKNGQFKKAIAYYALFQACIIKRPFNLFHRNNLHIRTADVIRNFGNKTTWEKPIKQLFIKFVNEANNAVFSNGKQCKSINESAFDIKFKDFDLLKRCRH